MARLTRKGDEYAKLYKAGNSLREVAAMTGVTHSAVRSALIRRRVKMRPSTALSPASALAMLQMIEDAKSG